jgi:predicted exporter
MKPQHFFITLFALITCCTIVGIIKLANTGLNLQTDLLSLIPASSRSPVVQKANDQLTNKFGNNFIYLVAANNQQSLLTTNKAIIQIIKDNQSIKLDDNQLAVENRITYFQWLKQYRFQLLNESQRNTLTDNDSSTLIQNAWRSLYNPGTVANIASPVEDPLNLFNQYLEQTYSSDNNFEIINNSVFITSEDHPDQHYNLISGSIASGAFSLQAQQELSISTTKIQNYIAAQNDNTKLYRAGAVFHATTAAHSAKRDISLISSGSALGIFILFISCFKSIRPLLASLASIIYGCICALVFCLWYFQSLHLLTLVFGASLEHFPSIL